MFQDLTKTHLALALDRDNIVTTSNSFENLIFCVRLEMRQTVILSATCELGDYHSPVLGAVRTHLTNTSLGTEVLIHLKVDLARNLGQFFVQRSSMGRNHNALGGRFPLSRMKDNFLLLVAIDRNGFCDYLHNGLLFVAFRRFLSLLGNQLIYHHVNLSARKGELAMHFCVGYLFSLTFRSLYHVHEGAFVDMIANHNHITIRMGSCCTIADRLAFFWFSSRK
mmetsp:Transcript_13838/g.22925  ORF Transcript_13838/g.22925 Transcript_13838/m.22925 type:complete len:223 (+) Transcript_13838:210-878(+)